MSHILAWLPIASMLACKACASCMPGLPDDMESTTDSADTAQDEQETADTHWEDTSPPPPCDIPEVEPNDNLNESYEIERELWTCGTFSEEFDFEWMTFPASDAEWYEVLVSAEDMGSPANVTLWVSDDAMTEFAMVTGNRYTSDPWLVFPSLGADSYYLYIFEDDGLYGDDYEWKLRVSETKMTLDWDMEEQEPNDSPFEALSMEDGQTVFGTLTTSNDMDWYHVNIPDDKSTIVFQVEAYGSGSPANTRLILYTDAAVSTDTADPFDTVDDWVARAFSDESDYDRDPRMEYSVSDPGDYYMVLKEAEGLGSELYWYTMSLSIEQE